MGTVPGAVEVGLSRRVLGLERLPLAPVSARAVIESVGDAVEDDARLGELGLKRKLARLDLDPGWVLARARAPHASPLEIIAETAWWPSASSLGLIGQVLDRIWRNSVATAISASRFALDAADSDAPAVFRAGLLANLGLWAAAAVDLAWVARWFQTSGPQARRQLEKADLGLELAEVGRSLAESWGLEPLLVDAAWLHRDRAPELLALAHAPERLRWIQEGVRLAESGPWSLHGIAQGRPTVGGSPGLTMPGDTRASLIEGEVKARCAGGFLGQDFSQAEEQVVRRFARVRRALAHERAERGRAEAFQAAFAAFDPGRSAAEWADAAAFSLCQQDGVHAAQVEWLPAPGEAAATPASAHKPPAFETPLLVRGRPAAFVRLWGDPGSPVIRDWTQGQARVAWQNWAALITAHERAETRSHALAHAIRGAELSHDDRLAREKLDALAEFAAGAGHELNNPLAVMIGRAQLLLTSATDANARRSLKLIVEQGNRLHRMLRDLIFIARPPQLTISPTHPAHALQKAIDELAPDLKAREIQLIPVWDAPTDLLLEADPAALVHLAALLLKNAIQATPVGGAITVRSVWSDQGLTWSFEDSGPGFSPEHALRLVDPFYCGREAGRGLGLGLPRAAILAERLGAQLGWSSSRESGAIFTVQFSRSSPRSTTSRIA